MGLPRWADPDADLSVSKERQLSGRPGGRQPPKKRLPQRKCGCGCGEWAGWGSPNGHSPGKPNRFLFGHQVSKMSLANKKTENEMAREMAEAEARREIEEFEANLDRLFDEARALGLTGDARIAYVYSDDMEELAIRRILRRAVLEGNKNDASWAHMRKHGSAKGTGKAVTGAKEESPGFLDPSDLVDEGDWTDD